MLRMPQQSRCFSQHACSAGEAREVCLAVVRGWTSSIAQGHRQPCTWLLRCKDTSCKAPLRRGGALQELGSSIAMHIVATRPLSLDKKSVPVEALEGQQLLMPLKSQ